MPTPRAVDFIFFGGTGDLAMRKLLPALYNRHRDGDLGTDGRIVGVARADLTREQYVAQVEASCIKFVAPERFSPDLFARFAQCLDYRRLDATDVDGYRALGAVLNARQTEVRVFFLSTTPDLFAPICANLAAADLVDARSRVVLEKPIGRDIASANQINEEVARVFSEPQIFRIDHYLGKEPVQNLMALRFGNVLFEPLWNRTWVRDVQITIAETVGVERRGDFYVRIGALRDMVQSHLLQLLCIIAMEPPATIDPDAVRDEKVKVLRALDPFSPGELALKTVRGQYRAGTIDGKPVPGFLEEPGIPPDCGTETFVALKAEINNWRWSGVPFYLRTGKRMAERKAEIVVTFRSVPHSIFPEAVGGMQNNRLVIELQPDESLQLNLMAKTPGERLHLGPVNLSLDFSEQFATRPMDAYERLLMDVIRGQLTLFLRRDEVDAAWRWVEPILRGWEEDGSRPKTYSAGTWGPAGSSALIGHDGSAWREEF
ncbi:MAG: glucose-6-phosphate dehydrogenase [Casimicrobiaceae bacterium]